MKNSDSVIVLTDPTNHWSHIFLLKTMIDNISYGRKPDGSLKLYRFDEGTPNKTNIIEPLVKNFWDERLFPPEFSHNSGFYKNSFSLILKTKDSSAKIYYTLNGSIPTKNSNIYTKPILIPSKDNSATIVRARIYKKGYPKSKVITHSYFINKNIYNKYNTPIVSLVTDPKNLFSYEKGIYVLGKTFYKWRVNNLNENIDQTSPANYNQRGKNWERQGVINLFDEKGNLKLSQNIGVRIHGGYSRFNKLKSLSLSADKNYDDTDYFNYNFFDKGCRNKINNSQITQFSKILLRTSATDSKHSLYRDVLTQSLIQPVQLLDTQNSNPCIVYINGKYYGIHNIRETYDSNYINSYYNIDNDNIVIIKNPTGGTAVEVEEGFPGDEMHYNRLINYIKKYDLKVDSNYNFVKSQIDINNFIEYNILQIYCDNRDWPGNNVRIWRKRTPIYEPNSSYGHDGRWRWLVFDLDYGFGLFIGDKAATNNSLERATEENGPDWPNPPWSTLLLRNLLKNSEFKNQFINTFADRLNTVYSTEVVLDKIEKLQKIYYPNIQTHINKWDLHNKTIENWKKEIEVLKSFAIKRPHYMRKFIIEYFHLKDLCNITINMSEGGFIKVNSLEIRKSNIPWKGTYFKDIPITLEAIPDPGFTFVGWEGNKDYQNKSPKIHLSETYNLKATFKRLKND
ncbi:CotH kinase family protein [Dethiothermospora halolimnae]|uniref:CotH kinase family protein n=1 Tax=Dethiothermospora halolimnae TaxID=3114390 RepID=UPI003CCC1ABF